MAYEVQRETRSEDSMKKCEYCKKPIIFIKTEKNEKMPVEPLLLNRKMTGYETGVTLDGKVVKGPTKEVLKYYIPHWGNCPKAKE